MNDKRSWKWVKLGDFAKVISGFAFRSESFQVSGIPVIKIANIRIGQVDLSETEKVDPSFLSLDEKYHVKSGDILISLTGSHLTQQNSVVGRVALFRNSLQHCLLNQRAGKILVRNRDACDSLFLFYSLSEPSQMRKIAILAHGAANQANVSPTQVESLELALPPLEVQRRIVSILSAYDDLIENNTRRIKILEEMAQMIYREWFVHFRLPNYEKVKMVESDIGSIPKGWRIFKFAELLQSSSGGDWGTDIETAEETSPVLVIRGTDFDDVQSGSILRTPRRFITPASLEKRQLLSGDIVIENSVNAKTRCTGTSLLVSSGMLRRMQGDCIAASFCKFFRLKDTNLAPLIYLHLRHLHREGRMLFYQNVAANGIANFQTSRFVESERIVLPTDTAELQGMLSTLVPLTSSNPADRIYSLRQSRDLLLPNLISGEVSVEQIEAEAVAQGV